MEKARKPVILVVGPTPPPYNGMSVVTETIVNSLPKEKFNLINLDTADRRRLRNIGKLDCINIYLALLYFLKFLWLLIRKKPDAVYVPIAQNTLGYLRDCLFLVPAQLFRKKLIIHLHGGYFKEFYEESNRMTKSVIRRTLQGVQRAIVLGDTFKSIFNGLIPPERIAVVPNGVDENSFSRIRVERSNPGPRGKQLKVVFLGSLIKSKGFMDLLYAIPLVLMERKNVDFIFAGELRSDKERKEAMEFIAQKNLQPFVSFTGVVSGETKCELLSSSDLFVFPSHYRYEGHPLVVLEAMAAGLPVITTNIGAIKETVIDGENGFVIEPGNPKQIAEKILLLLKDEKLRSRMGNKSRERFLKYYTKDRFIENVVKVFEGVLYQCGQARASECAESETDYSKS